MRYIYRMHGFAHTFSNFIPNSVVRDVIQGWFTFNFIRDKIISYSCSKAKWGLTTLYQTRCNHFSNNVVATCWQQLPPHCGREQHFGASQQKGQMMWKLLSLETERIPAVAHLQLMVCQQNYLPQFGHIKIWPWECTCSIWKEVAPADTNTLMVFFITTSDYLALVLLQHIFGHNVVMLDRFRPKLWTSNTLK